MAMINMLQNVKSAHNNTDLVTLHLPSGSSLEQHRATVRSEMAVSANIKDRKHGRNIAHTLRRLDSYLTSCKALPKTGLALCAGQWV